MITTRGRETSTVGESKVTPHYRDTPNSSNCGNTHTTTRPQSGAPVTVLLSTSGCQWRWWQCVGLRRAIRETFKESHSLFQGKMKKVSDSEGRERGRRLLDGAITVSLNIKCGTFIKAGPLVIWNLMLEADFLQSAIISRAIALWRVKKFLAAPDTSMSFLGSTKRRDYFISKLWPAQQAERGRTIIVM